MGRPTTESVPAQFQGRQLLFDSTMLNKYRLDLSMYIPCKHMLLKIYKKVYVCSFNFSILYLMRQLQGSKILGQL